MARKSASEPVVTKAGMTIEENYCRKCMKVLPASHFYEYADAGFIDSNGLMSVCKKCVQVLYEKLYAENNSMEKSIHKLCTSLNIRFSNEAVSATKAHINTLLEKGSATSSVFSIYKMKLVATKKSMDKQGVDDNSYEDVTTIFTSETPNSKEIPIPKEVVDFWGKDNSREDIEFLETQYSNFKGTHKTDTYAEIVLLKEVCFTLLTIKKYRANGDDTQKATKELRDLMTNLAISPNALASSQGDGKGSAAFGLWIQDIELYEPVQWLLSDPRGDMYRDVGNVEEYFQNYFVRPLKNAIMGSKDFNIDGEDGRETDVFGEDDVESFKLIDDGEL